MTDELARVKAPLTVVYAVPEGETAPRVRASYGAAYRGKARLVPIERSGHMIMWDQPALFRAALKEFLAR
jgi:pimeloyl-ACP methyl ester carboxylesterase